MAESHPFEFVGNEQIECSGAILGPCNSNHGIVELSTMKAESTIQWLIPGGVTFDYIDP
jgi:hypothetical protein